MPSLSPPLRAGLLALGLLAGPAHARAQQLALPPDLQVALISKILGFDRRVGRYGETVVLGILYQPRNHESAELARDVVDAARAIHTVGDGTQALRTVLLPVSGEIDLPAELRRQGIDLLYVAPLRAAPLRRLLEQADEAGVLTVSGDADAIEAGTAVGLEQRGPRPAISVRLRSARHAGSDFDSRFLRLAQVRP